MKALDNRFYVKFMQLEIGLLVRETSFYAREMKNSPYVDKGTCDLSGRMCNQIPSTKRLQF